MQLFIILALLLFGGRKDAENIISEVKPVLESLGGEEMKEALKSAEEISEVLNAVQAFSAGGEESVKSARTPANLFGSDGEESGEKEVKKEEFPLAPISAIADREITYCLNKFVENG